MQNQVLSFQLPTFYCFPFINTYPFQLFNRKSNSTQRFDEEIYHRNCIKDASFRLRRVDLIDTITELWHFYAIIQCYIFHIQITPSHFTNQFIRRGFLISNVPSTSLKNLILLSLIAFILIM